MTAELPLTAARALANEATLRAPRVLLAEDDPAFRETLRESLQGEGYEVVEAADGRALLTALGQALAPGGRRFDLVVSDVRMPGGSGLDVLEQNFARDPDTPFLLITAFGDRLTHARASEFGVEVIDKPFEMDELLARARSLLEGWGAR